MSKIIGIDLGTTNSCAALRQGNNTRVIESVDARSRTTPSVVQVRNGKVLVGQAAKMQASTLPELTYFSIKRLLGKKLDDPQIQAMAGALPFSLVAGPNGEAYLAGKDGASYSPTELLGHILRKMRGSAESMTSDIVEDCVLACPAYFNADQRSALRDAAAAAGLKVALLINEPTAAAIAYGMERAENKTIGVFDLGGGTFDFTILKISRGQFVQVASAGNPALGGEDFDRRILEHVAKVFEQRKGFDPRIGALNMQRLREEVEKAKHQLSAVVTHDIVLQVSAPNGAGLVHDVITMTRDDLEAMCDDLIQATLEPCKDALKQASLDADELDEIVLIGGMTAMPAVRELVADFFGKQPRTDVSATEAVAVGAAIRAAAFIGDIKGLKVKEPLGQSIGIEDAAGKFIRIAGKRQTLPIRERTINFLLAKDKSKTVAINVYQGELGAAASNKLIGWLGFKDLPEGPLGEVYVEATFEVDEAGLLTVKAKAGGQEKTKAFHPASGMSADELERLRAVIEGV